MFDDSKDPLAPPQQLQEPFDAPPEYTPLEPQASSSTAHVVGAPPSEETAHLFTRPQFAEDLLQSVDAERLHDTQNLEWTVTGSGDVRSWDPKLADPMALYEFVRYHAQIPPQIKVRLGSGRPRVLTEGSHTETRNSNEIVTENGRTRSENVTRQETVTDFDFNIDLAQILHPPTVPSSALDFFAVPPWAPAYRGGTKLSFAPVEDAMSTAQGGHPSKIEPKLWRDWASHRWDLGVPSWIKLPADFQASKKRGPRLRNQLALAEEGEGLLAQHSSSIPQTDVDTSERDRADIMQWCEAYCASPAKLKAFTLQKQVWGWDTKAVNSAVTSIILSTGYRSNKPIYVGIVVTGAEVRVMPDFWLSKATYNRVIFVISCILLIYPFIWLWARLTKNDPVFDTVRVAYPLKAYIAVDDKTETQGASIKMGPDGKRHHLIGTREGAWVRQWEATIREAVFSHRQGWLTSRVDPIGNYAALGLDGYERDA